MSKEIVKVEEQQQAAQEWRNIKSDKQDVLTRLKTMLVAGKKMTTDQVAALAVYSITNDLNPFNGECYYLDKVGIIPGIAGWRRKAAEQMIVEANEAGVPGGHFSIEYEPATNIEAVFDKNNGDIAWKATLTDSVSQSRWLGELIDTAKEFKTIFSDEQFGVLMTKAEEICGSKPSWEAVGVVSGDEHFSGLVYENGKATNKRKPEMWDRNERAKKRAAKNAIRQRFSGLTLPSQLLGGKDIVDSEFLDIEDEPDITIEQPEEAPSVERPGEEEILSELGFDTEGKATPHKTNGERSWHSSIIAAIVKNSDKGVNGFQAVGRLNKSALPDPCSPAQAVAWNDVYDKAKELGKESDEAARLANEWLAKQ